MYTFFKSAVLGIAISSTAVQAAGQLFRDYAIPDNLSSQCAKAFTIPVDCLRSVSDLDPSIYVAKTQLEKICTSNCGASLLRWEKLFTRSCVSDNWLGPDGVQEPVSLIAERVLYNYNLTCLSDGSRFCNNVGAAYAAYLDPDAVALPGGAPAGGDYGGYTITSDCDRCLVSIVRFKAGSPYEDGPDMQSSSVYQSLTSSCGIKDMPLTITSPSITTTTQPEAPAPTCSGKTYNIVVGDDCNSIAKSQGIATEWLLTDNNLLAHCSDFPTQGQLCLVNTCKVYIVGANETCQAIASKQNITESQLQAWNPSIDAGCYNLADMAGNAICVGKPGDAYKAPGETTLAPTSATTAAPVPSDIAEGTNHQCGRYYEVIPGDYCNLLTLKFRISLDDFIFLNPAVNSNCTNLYAGESYCVQAVGDINTYSGRPGYVSYTVGATQTGPMGDPATTLPPIKWTPSPTSTQMPLASDTRTDCANYINGTKYQVDKNGTSWISNCDFVAAVYGVDLGDLGIWNPSLGNSSDPTCMIQPGMRYCAKYYEGERPMESDPDDAGSALPTRDGMDKNCTETVDVDESGTPDCQTILNDYHITIVEFFKWNPSVKADCSGMWAGYQYCIAVDAPSTTDTPTGTPTTSNGPGAPTQSGQPTNCNKWYVAQSGDTCSVPEKKFSLSHTQFIKWNPAVSVDCTSGFWVGEAYCVGVSGGQTPTTTTSAGPGAPTQTGQPSNCNKWYVAQSGDTCAVPENKFKVSHDQFIKWNPAVSSDCTSGFWVGEAYCVGVAGASPPPSTSTSTKSTSTGPPAPTQPGQPSNCNKWYVAKSGDTCAIPEQNYHISHAQFIKWNPAVSSDCTSGFWVGEAYCVSTS